jgi:hypothetical protein
MAAAAVPAPTDAQPTGPAPSWRECVNIANDLLRQQKETKGVKREPGAGTMLESFKAVAEKKRKVPKMCTLGHGQADGCTGSEELEECADCGKLACSDCLDNNITNWSYCETCEKRRCSCKGVTSQECDWCDTHVCSNCAEECEDCGQFVCHEGCPGVGCDCSADGDDDSDKEGPAKT